MSETSSLGLRERKKLRTERSIIRAAAELSLEGGFAAATIPRIAERADVAPRTVSRWFPVKEDILFSTSPAKLENARAHFEAGTGDTIDRLEAWLADEIERAPDDVDHDLEALRARAIESDPELRSRSHRYLDAIRDLIAQSVARDTGSRPDTVGPQVIAGAAIGLLVSIRSATLAETPKHEATADLATVYAFLRSGLETLTHTSP